MKHIAIIAFALAVSSALAGNVWWVDDDNFNKAGMDGRTSETAFGTIQAALDNSEFTAGDTVKVLPGVYSQGGKEANGLCRVVVPKSCTIVSTEGKNKTFIVGRKPSGGNWYGEDAVRCIYLNLNADVRIEGFTIMNGATSTKNGDATGYGGGICNNKVNKKVVVVDCTIKDCAANKGAAARCATLVRCLVEGNHCDGSGSVLNSVDAYSCIICNNTGGSVLSTCNSVHSSIVNNEYGIAGNGSYRNTMICGTVKTEIFTGNYTIVMNNSTTTAADGLQQAVAPIFGDYRPVKGSPADGKGVGFDHASEMVNVPTEDLYLDFNRKQIATSGACDIGAIQGVVSVSGGIQIAGGDVTLDGRLLRAGHCVFTEYYPTQWCMKAVVPDGKYLYGFHRGDITVNRFHADLDNKVYVMPPPAGVSTNTVVFADRAFWVNPNKDDDGNSIGDDGNSGSQTAPFQTLQKAMDVSKNSKYTIVFAAEGRYDKGGRCVHEGQNNNWRLTNRVCAVNNGCYVYLRGAGAGKSFIVGECDPDTDGNGPKAVRPVGVYCNFMTIQGFTLTNGYSGVSSSDQFDQYGAVCGRTATGLHVLDCEIVGCHGVSGIGSRFTMGRSRVHKNESKKHILSEVHMLSSILDDNLKLDASSGDLRQCRLINSIAYGKDGDSLLCANGNEAYVSILVNSDSSFGADNKAYETLVWNVGKVSNLSGSYQNANPYFFSPVDGDYRVPAFSKAVSMAEVPNGNNYGVTYWQYAFGDYFGNPIVFTQGSPMIGAVHTIYRDPGFYVNADNGGLSLANGWYPIDTDDSLSVSAAGGSRPCIGFTIGSRTNLFSETPTGTYTIADCPEATLITPIYTTDWYVDAVNGTSEGLGFSVDTAKLTFADLFNTGYVMSGDTVHAAEGEYDEGVMYFPDLSSGVRKYTVGSRVIVPEGVSIVADGRVEHTIIKGASASNPSDYGLGSDAVRCVTLSKNSKVKGFTLKGGRTDNNDTVGTNKAKEYPDNVGALAYGGITSSTTDARDKIIEDCILTDGVARRGGGAAYVHLVRCKVFGTRGVDPEATGAASLNCWHTGTLITDLLSNYGVLYPQSFVNCTVCETNKVNTFWRPAVHGNVRNSIIICSGGFNNISLIESCVFGMLPNGSLIAGVGKVLGETSKIVKFEELKFDNDWRPIIGANAAVDFGSNYAYAELTDSFFAYDLGGGQRIMNGVIDCGAMEADWRERYADNISESRKLSVLNASVNVKETDAGKVCLNGESTLIAKWNCYAGATCEFTVRVFSGVLTVSLGDDVRTVSGTSGKETVLRFKDMLDSNIEFAFVGDNGYAEILNGSLLRGFTVSLR